jgi:hypothetical protein
MPHPWGRFGVLLGKTFAGSFARRLMATVSAQKLPQ